MKNFSFAAHKEQDWVIHYGISGDQTFDGKYIYFFESMQMVSCALPYMCLFSCYCTVSICINQLLFCSH